jgi:exosortase
MSGYLIYKERDVIFSTKKYSVTAGGLLILAGIVFYKLGNVYETALNENDYLSVIAFSAVLFWLGGFIFFYGVQSFNNSRFPFLFMLLMIPIPLFIIDPFVVFLQKWSAEFSFWIFNIIGIPPLREGFIFHFPPLSVEVSEECSGIRSSLALVITSIIAGHFFLKTARNKIILVLAIIPVTIFKNAVRIVTITTLSIYVDESFLTSSLLHKQGGILFFILALSVLAPVLHLLRKSERTGQMYSGKLSKNDEGIE